VLGTERGQRLPSLDDALGRFVGERAAGLRPSFQTIDNPLAKDQTQKPYRGTAA
jgi:hypothetical protein